MITDLTWVELGRVLDGLVDGLLQRTIVCPPTTAGLRIRPTTLTRRRHEANIPMRIRYHESYHLARTVIAEWVSNQTEDHHNHDHSSPTAPNDYRDQVSEESATHGSGID